MNQRTLVENIDHEQHPIDRTALRTLQARPALPPAAGVRRARRSRRASLIPSEHLADAPPPLPEVGEIDLVRHFANLSTRNMSVDTHFYPLGSCTMKYNPKRNERLAALPGIADLHPLSAGRHAARACCNCSTRCRSILAEIAGLAAVLAAAGRRGAGRADGAAGRGGLLPRPQARSAPRCSSPTAPTAPTRPAPRWPASTRSPSRAPPSGFVDLDDLQAKLDDQTAVFMITNPNTLGLFEPQIATIAELVHERGGLVYLDGANMNAILGIARPGDFGADMMHYNVAQDVQRPARRRRPGRGADRGARSARAVSAGAGRRRKTATAIALDYDRPQVDRPRAQLLRQRRRPRSAATATSARTGPDGLRRRQRERRAQRQLPAEPREARLAGAAGRPLHARVRRQRPRKLKDEKGITAMDIAKRLLDYGFHAPTVYFPLIGAGGDDDRADRDGEQGNARRLRRGAAADHARKTPSFLHDAPHTHADQPARRGEGGEGADPAVDRRGQIET